jgi:hypothetical protein
MGNYYLLGRDSVRSSSLTWDFVKVAEGLVENGCVTD